MKQEIYLTTFEFINTYGFLKLMAIIWMPTVVYITMILLYMKYKR